MTYGDVIQGLRDDPCAVDYCDSIRFPFGAYKGELVSTVVRENPRWVAQFRYSLLQKDADENNPCYEDNLALLFSMGLLLSERR